MPSSVVNIGAEEAGSAALAAVKAAGWDVGPLPSDVFQDFLDIASPAQAPLPAQVRASTRALARSLKDAGVSAARLSPLLQPWLYAPLEAALRACGIDPLHDNGRGTLIATGTGGIGGDGAQPTPDGSPIFKVFGTEVSPAEAKKGVVLAPLTAVARVRLLRRDYTLRNSADAADRTHYAVVELARILGRHAAGTPIFVWLDLHPALVSFFEAGAQHCGLVVVHRFVPRPGAGQEAAETFVPAISSPADASYPGTPVLDGPRNPLLASFHARFVPDPEGSAI